MKYNELTQGQIEAVVNKLGGMEGVRRFLSDELKVVVPVVTNIFHLIVDYAHDLDDMVMAGKYFQVGEYFTKAHFPKIMGEAVELDVALIHFNHEISSSDRAIKELDKIGYRPATIEELLSFGATYPNIQREFPILALGSSCRVLGGDRRAAYLDKYRSSYGSEERFLDMGMWDGILGSRFRFLAVCK